MYEVTAEDLAEEGDILQAAAPFEIELEESMETESTASESSELSVGGTKSSTAFRLLHIPCKFSLLSYSDTLARE